MSRSALRPLSTPQTPVEADPRYFGPTEVDLLIADLSKAKLKLGWQAATLLEQIVREVVWSGLKAVHQ